MTAFAISIFTLTGFLCVFTYALYPIVIWVAGKVKPFNPEKNDQVLPSVSIIIAAYNEQRHIEQKIENTLALDYPEEKLEILIGSDGSTDDTPSILGKIAQRSIYAIHFSDNRGKTSVQNDLVDRARGEILVFTDAASFLRPDALRKIVRNFNDKAVGCVAGKMVFIGTDTNVTTQSQGVYWRYEIGIRSLESRVGSLIGVDGPLYAMRRKLYVPLQPDMISDFLSPLLVLRQGWRVVLEQDAVVDEEPKKKADHEFTTRRRITLRALMALASHRMLLDPLKRPGLSFQIISHKLLRWAVGPMAVLNFIASLFLFRKMLFQLVIAGYLAFSLLGLIGWRAAEQGRKISLVSIPYYFILVNAAAFMGIVDFFMRRKATTWQTLRD